ncbi:MAG TPA: DUF1311 domain-containing protein [Aliiroseovarius sp.]|nr:DUF1311 domain-containing protein [Aliiroseovarius sp.]
MTLFKILPIVLFLAGPAGAQELVFSMQATDACLSTAAPGTEAACIGRSAESCMAASEAGGSNLGAAACYGKEAAAWDARLNDSYRTAIARAREADADMVGMSITPPSQEEALRQMQQAWIPYRDAKCEYVYSLFQGGTGGGPASSACLMEETAHQALYLQQKLRDF